MRVAATIGALAAAMLLHAGRCAGQPTPTATALPAGTVAACIGDCDGDAVLAINEMVLAVSIALGNAEVSECLAAACQGDQLVHINCLIGAVRNGLHGCPATPTPLGRPTRTPLPAGALGVRRFSINPATSQFIVVPNPMSSFPTAGFEGFIELTAGKLVDGGADIDITDASEYLSINLPDAGTALCFRVLRERLPVHNAGGVDCTGGLAFGVQAGQDHNIGVVGTCRGGSSAGQSCSGDDQCGDGTCFTRAACAAAYGSVEGPNGPHPGVCNGPYGGAPDIFEPSPAGSVALWAGLPVELLRERSTPCGDEGVTGVRQPLGLTTARSWAWIRNSNNQPGVTLSAEITGVPFSCESWTEEDGPGTLVFSTPILDSPLPGSVSDMIGMFMLVD